MERICTDQPTITVKLPKAYIKEDLLINYEEIITHKNLASWSYLDRVKAQFNQYEGEIPIGMIIGTNCIKAV